MVAKSNNSNNGGQFAQEPKVRKKLTRYGIQASLIQRVKVVSPLSVVSAVTLFCIGLCVVALSVMGHISPLWLASLMSIFGSVSTMIGLYQLYELLSEKSELDNLYKEAIKRVINSQN